MELTLGLAASDLEKLPEYDVLKRALSVNSVISTSSSFAVRYQNASKNRNLQLIMNQIGKGLQGTIFENIGQSLALKKENPGNENLRSNLQHEFGVHQRVAAAFDQFAADKDRVGIRIPRPFRIMDSIQGQQLDFPDGYKYSGNVVTMERILPLPKVIRRALVAQFYPGDTTTDPKTIDSIVSLTPNKHCLARVYLGRPCGIRKKEGFSLRNFPLYLEEMVDLELGVESLATTMGQAFAIMQWGAGVNGDDVEFVLGTDALKHEVDLPIGFQRRSVGLYLLDFGQCDVVNLADATASVYQAFKGAMVTGDNQLFIPHCHKTPTLFGAFKAAYIKAGHVILQKKGLTDKFNMEDFMAEYEEYAEDFLL